MKKKQFDNSIPKPGDSYGDFYIHDVRTDESEKGLFEGLSQQEKEKRMFYRPFCDKEEIDRIMDVKNAKDYLLKLRADTIIDHMRLYRVYLRKYRSTKNWNFEESFEKKHFDIALNSLSKENREKCKSITMGNIFSTEPNGCICTTDYGPIITIDDSLSYFLEFTNLALMPFSTKEVPLDIRFNALIIAIRIMMKKEALDFELDPRGIIPYKIKTEVRSFILSQLRFVAGHEFAHHLLGHVSSAKIKEKEIMRKFFSSSSNEKTEKFYTYLQKQEFDADEGAINFQRCSEKEQKKLISAALLFFAGLAVFESVEDFFFPPANEPDHPPAIDRFDALVKKYIQDKEEINIFSQIREFTLFWQKTMVEHASLYPESFEFYGSIYLAKPNTKWRGRALVDRVDY